MDEQNLENVVSYEFLHKKDFRPKGTKMVRYFHEHEIVFIEVAHEMYIFDNVYPVRKRLSDYGKGGD